MCALLFFEMFVTEIEKGIKKLKKKKKMKKKILSEKCLSVYDAKEEEKKHRCRSYT